MILEAEFRLAANQSENANTFPCVQALNYSIVAADQICDSTIKKTENKTVKVFSPLCNLKFGVTSAMGNIF